MNQLEIGKLYYAYRGLFTEKDCGPDAARTIVLVIDYVPEYDQNFLPPYRVLIGERIYLCTAGNIEAEVGSEYQV